MHYPKKETKLSTKVQFDDSTLIMFMNVMKLYNVSSIFIPSIVFCLERRFCTIYMRSALFG